jgi:hypothetical protein
MIATTSGNDEGRLNQGATINSAGAVGPPLTKRVHSACLMRGTILLCFLFLAPLCHGVSANVADEGKLHDVLIIDLACIEENVSCAGWRPAHLVEYFGADWCDPCESVETQLNQRESDDTFVMSHHPSKSDLFWLNASNQRFANTFQLWGYPDLIIDGEGFLAGKTQSLELEMAISDSEVNLSGLTSANLQNGELFVNHSLSGQLIIEVWTVANQAGLVNLATNYSIIDEENNSVSVDGDFLVILLSTPGIISTVSASSNPAHDLEPEGGIQSADEALPKDNLDTILIITGLLILMVLPATWDLIKTIRQEPPNEEE